MNVNITLHYAGKSLVHEMPKNASIMPLLRDAGHLAQVCGIGKCGKCHIKANTKPNEDDKALLSKEELNAGIRLACHTKAQENLEITILEQSTLHVVTQFTKQSYPFMPLVESLHLDCVMPHLDDQRDDMQRILDAAECTDHTLSFTQIIELSNTLHAGDPIHILRQGTTLLGKANSHNHLAVAVDIGTTTLAAMLIDLNTHHIVAVRGEANAQAAFGADVISRIQQTIPEITPEYQENIHALQKSILNQLDSLCTNLLHDAYTNPDEQTIHYMTVAGNTTMMHLLCGLPAVHISRAPFIPMTLESMRIPAQSLGLQSHAEIFLMPSISSYIGADIVAALLAANAHIPQKPFILLDLGTNAEIVLGHNGQFLACSAAAGPCFEGANLSCGMSGQSGAINTVQASSTPVGFTITTLDNAPAKGLCGSGVLDAIAMLLQSGDIDETGLLEAQDNALAKAIHLDDKGQSFFAFTDKVRLTQRDIREVQLAKAAVRAGIHTLLAEAQLDVHDIDTLYIAGGFGSAMNPQSAGILGLIPKALATKAKALGNAAGLGVVRYATEKNVQQHVKNIITNTRYLELSASATFPEIYVDHMIFGTE